MPFVDSSRDITLLAEAKSAVAPSARAAAFAELYQRHQGSLYRFVLLRSGSADAAADIVQEIFLQLMTDRLKFDATRGGLQGFLFGVARNFVLKRESRFQRFVAIDTANDDSEDVVLVDGAPQPIEKLLTDERAERVRQALVQLAPHYRDVLILYEMHDLSYVDIAQICDIDIGTVRSRLSRGRARMATLLTSINETFSPALKRS